MLENRSYDTLRILTVADDGIAERAAQCSERCSLESCKSIPNPEVQLNTNRNCINLTIIKIYRILRSPDDVPT
jgi:hypothetical protein